jgi:hypothetical protein
MRGLQTGPSPSPTYVRRSNSGVIQSETKVKDVEASPTTTLVSTRGIGVTASAGHGIQFRRS